VNGVCVCRLCGCGGGGGGGVWAALRRRSRRGVRSEPPWTAALSDNDIAQLAINDLHAVALTLVANSSGSSGSDNNSSLGNKPSKPCYVLGTQRLSTIDVVVAVHIDTLLRVPIDVAPRRVLLATQQRYCKSTTDGRPNATTAIDGAGGPDTAATDAAGRLATATTTGATGAEGGSTTTTPAAAAAAAVTARPSVALAPLLWHHQHVCGLLAEQRRRQQRHPHA